MSDWIERIWKSLERMEPLGVAIEVGGFLLAVAAWLYAQGRRLKQGGYVAKVEKSRSCAAAASNAVHRLWRGDPLLSKDEYWELVKYNPDIPVSIFDDKNRMVGFFDVFPLKTEAAEAFLDGETTEHTLLTKDALYDPKNAQSSKYIYIGTVMGLPSVLRSGERLRLEYSMIRPMLKYLEKKFPPTRDRIYFAMASSKLGLNWLNECGFTPRAIPSFASGKLRHIYQLDSERVKEARRKARDLRTKNDMGRLLRIKCRWKDAAASEDAPAAA